MRLGDCFVPVARSLDREARELEIFAIHLTRIHKILDQQDDRFGSHESGGARPPRVFDEHPNGVFELVERTGFRERRIAAGAVGTAGILRERDVARLPPGSECRPSEGRFSIDA
jgi:hypothetical protein